MTVADRTRSICTEPTTFQGSEFSNKNAKKKKRKNYIYIYGQETTVRTLHGTTDWFKIGKGVCQCCILSPVYLNYMKNTLCEMPGWMNHKLESRLPGEIATISYMKMPLL